MCVTALFLLLHYNNTLAKATCAQPDFSIFTEFRICCLRNSGCPYKAKPSHINLLKTIPTDMSTGQPNSQQIQFSILVILGYVELTNMCVSVSVLACVSLSVWCVHVLFCACGDHRTAVIFQKLVLSSGFMHARPALHLLSYKPSSKYLNFKIFRSKKKVNIRYCLALEIAHWVGHLIWKHDIRLYKTLDVTAYACGIGIRERNKDLIRQTF